MAIMMKNPGFAIVCAVTLLASGACNARDPFPGGSLISGRVQGNYLRAAPGVFIEAGIAQRSMSAPMWVDVAPHDGGTGVMAQLPSDMVAERGANVEVRVAHQNRPAIAPVGERTRVVHVQPPTGDPSPQRVASVRE